MLGYHLGMTGYTCRNQLTTGTRHDRYQYFFVRMSNLNKNTFLSLKAPIQFSLSPNQRSLNALSYLADLFTKRSGRINAKT